VKSVARRQIRAAARIPVAATLLVIFPGQPRPKRRPGKIMLPLELTYTFELKLRWHGVGSRILESPLLLILVVEDDALIKEMVQDALSEGGFD
jgi:hypothetical protein